jgi:heme oxygenase
VIDSSERFPFDAAMADSPCLTANKRAEQAERAERLARALRENLHRRKAQARAKEIRDAGEPAQPDEDAPRS